MVKKDSVLNLEKHSTSVIVGVYSARIPRGLPRGFHALAKPDPQGRNSVIPRQLAAGIGILRILILYYTETVKLPHYSNRFVLIQQL